MPALRQRQARRAYVRVRAAVCVCAAAQAAFFRHAGDVRGERVCRANETLNILL